MPRGITKNVGLGSRKLLLPGMPGFDSGGRRSRSGGAGAPAVWEESFATNPLPKYTRITNMVNDAVYAAGPPPRVEAIAGASLTGYFLTTGKAVNADCVMYGQFLYGVAATRTAGCLLLDPATGNWVMAMVELISSAPWLDVQYGTNASFGTVGQAAIGAGFANTPYWCSLTKAGNSCTARAFSGDPRSGGAQIGSSVVQAIPVGQIASLGTGQKLAPGFLARGDSAQIRSLALDCAVA